MKTLNSISSILAFLFGFLFIILSLSNCKKLESFQDNPINGNEETFIIMHRGGGFSGEGRNTLAGAIYGMSVADGIELDVQFSQDNTIWIEHDSRIEACENHPKKCFINLSDAEIEDRISCGDFYTVRLEEIFEEASQNYPNTIIVLDCKSWAPCGISEMNSIRAMKEMGTKLIHLALKYDLEENIIVDSHVKPLLKVIKVSSGIKTFYRSFASLDKAARNAFDVYADGLSLDQDRYGLSMADIELINQKGLEVQLWTINDIESLNAVLGLKPQLVFSEVSIDGTPSLKLRRKQ